MPHPRQYCDEHRPKQRQRKKRSPVQTVRGERPVTAVVSDVAKATGAAKRATVDATAKLFSKLAVYASVILAMAIISGDPALTTDEDQERQVSELQLSDEQARAITHPLARLVTPTRMWQKVGPGLIENSDAFDALVALYDWASSLWRYKRERARREQAAQVAPTNGHVQAGPVIHAVPFTEAEGQVSYIPSTWGQQVGPSPEQ
ncbi:MAG: hypothetical protein ACP5VR_13720, partial [Acidimicrobiales bacterium]